MLGTALPWTTLHFTVLCCTIQHCSMRYRAISVEKYSRAWTSSHTLHLTSANPKSLYPVYLHTMQYFSSGDRCMYEAERTLHVIKVDTPPFTSSPQLTQQLSILLEMLKEVIQLIRSILFTLSFTLGASVSVWLTVYLTVSSRFLSFFLFYVFPSW